MKVNILASGSTGNCIAIRSGKTTILVDAGVAKTKIENRLLEVGIRPDSIEAIFITHAHVDHTKGLSLANKYEIPVYAGEGEWKSIKNVEDHLKNSIHGNGLLIDYEGYQDWMDIVPFNTHHDAFDPKGYVIKTENEKVSICLDTGHVDEEMITAMEDSTIYIIEANHEPNMVEVSDYPPATKARILSHIGHLSNEQTALVLSKLVMGVGEQIYLTHLSHKNNLPELAKITVIHALAKKGLRPDEDYKIEVV